MEKDYRARQAPPGSMEIICMIDDLNYVRQVAQDTGRWESLSHNPARTALQIAGLMLAQGRVTAVLIKRLDGIQTDEKAR
ncbi:hypothetical protein [Zavarzinia sp.]|uniref:hypothetical protein n=1 Tax=Zavarzinia sp. TaxID=2027920 RepID=UPI003BB79AB6